jgi:hypothetical protein
MTDTDITALIERLRAMALPSTPTRNRVDKEAADALESLLAIEGRLARIEAKQDSVLTAVTLIAHHLAHPDSLMADEEVKPVSEGDDYG